MFKFKPASSSEEYKVKVIIIIIAMIFVVFLALYLVQFLWTSSLFTNENNNENEESISENATTTLNKDIEIGSYVQISYTSDMIVKEYFQDIFTTLTSKSASDIYKITSQDFINEYKYTESSLYSMLSKKSLIGKAFECTKYTVKSNPRFGRIYALEIASIDSKVIDKILVIEESPRNYKISFDSYIGTKKENIEIIREGIKLSINNVKEYRNKINFSIQIENMNTKNIVLNNKNTLAEPINITLSDGSTVYPSSVWCNGNELTLKPGAIYTINLTFSTDDLLTSDIKKINLMCVYDEANDIENNLEFSIY